MTQTTPPAEKPSLRRRDPLEKMADQVTEAIGSTNSLIIHTLLFVFAFALVAVGVSMDWILLIITTAVSLEAIYLAVFIQRSTNKQARRLEHAIAEIRRNTVIHDRRPLDVVVTQIDRRVNRIEKELKAIEKKEQPPLPQSEIQH